MFLKSNPADLIEAGYPESQTKAFLDAYHALEQAESSSPGHVSQDVAAQFLNSSRELGEAVNPDPLPDRGDDRARNPFQLDEPVLARTGGLWHRRRLACSEPGHRHGHRKTSSEVNSRD